MSLTSDLDEILLHLHKFFQLIFLQPLFLQTTVLKYMVQLYFYIYNNALLDEYALQFLQ